MTTCSRAGSSSRPVTRGFLAAIAALALVGAGGVLAGPSHSVARQWNEALLDAISNDFARPVVHARNLHHVSAAMWDAWAAYDPQADAVLHHEQRSAADVQAAREAAISYAAYRLLRHRFATSPGNDPEDPDDPANTLNQLEALMIDLGYDPDYSDDEGTTPAALGVRIANAWIFHGLADGSNEANGYSNNHYVPVNDPLDLDESGNPGMIDPNLWQPLQQDDGFVDQSGNQVGQAQTFLGAEWGAVVPFALDGDDLSIYPDDSGTWDHWVYHDPGPPPMLGGPQDSEWKDAFVEVVEYSSQLDPADGITLDISPASRGGNSLGANDGDGYDLNPHTGEPYTPQQVLRGDYRRVISEYWADGPASETPPGHWFTIFNDLVNDSPLLERRIGGAGPELPDLEWDVKAYLALGGAMHDAAVASWGIKGHHDAVRPISAIRHMAEQGQSSDPDGPSYDPDGLPLEPGLIEVVTSESAATYHSHLAAHVGEIAVRAWRGHGYDPETETAGVGWILAKDWWPYQNPGFVTPPFAGYVSGHSTFSRAAAEVLTRLTGDSYFPGGLGEICFEAGEFLEFEAGPTETVCLQWATYYDASDESGISRIFGGIHPQFDDLPGRIVGHEIGTDAWNLAVRYYNGAVTRIFSDDFSGSARGEPESR
jgi:hypothetical protein